MVSQPIWITIIIGVFFIGIGVSYAYFANTYDPMSMKFQNQELFDQMMLNNPKMSQMWMDSGMMDESQMQEHMMNMMKQNPQQIQQMIMNNMYDSDQIQMMENMMKDMINRMQNDPELKQAMMEHMHRMKSSIDAMMITDESIKKEMTNTKTNFTSNELQQEKFNLENKIDLCTSDWYITGYFLPIESDYSGKSIKVSINKINHIYLADFLEVVKIEGWGKTHDGNYLGWDHGDFIISDRYLDAYGNDLKVGIVAVDNSVISHGSELIIPTLPEPWNDMVFSGLDEGPSINGKHIDVFTGEGTSAEGETFRITSYDNKVCIQN